MMNMKTILAGAERLLTQLVNREMDLQGHVLSGRMAAETGGIQKKVGNAHVLEGTSAHYAKYVNDGVKPESASMKQFPFLKAYFLRRGFDEKTAGGFAAATIKKWMKEGMSTQASKRFSKTGARQHAVESALTGGNTKVDQYMNESLDFSIDENYHLTKSETI